MSRGRPKPQRRLHIAVLSLIAALCVTASGPLTVRAAEIVTTTVLDEYPATVLSHTQVSYTAHMTPAISTGIQIRFEQSLDGISWYDLAYAPTDETGYATFTMNIGPFTPGTRYVRAHTYANPGQFTESFSDPLVQEYIRHTTAITEFRVINADSSLISPGTATLRLITNGQGMGGTAYFERFVAGDWTQLGGAQVNLSQGIGYAYLDVPGPGEGHQRYRVRIDQTDDITGGTRELEFDIAKAPSELSFWLPSGPPQAHHPFSIIASLNTAIDVGIFPRFSGEITVKNVATDAVVATLDANDTTIEMPAMEAGTFTIQGSFPGDSNILASMSDPFVVTVLPDSVLASSVRLDLTTFYPYKDGYRDTVVASGVREETSSVAIRIYGPTGKLVKSGTIASGIGAYTFPWTGRTSTGAMLANGKYKVVQTLTDAAGTPRSFASYVNLSSKRLYTYSTYLNKTLSQAAKRTSSWIGWEFYLPSATVYSSLRFEAYARSDGLPGLSMGGVDFRLCPSRTTWSTSCVGSWTNVRTTTGWTAKSLFTTHNRSGRYVRGIVAAFGSGVVYKARLKVVYKVLK